MTDEDRAVLAAEGWKELHRIERGMEQLAAILESLSGNGDREPPVWGVISTWTKVPRVRDIKFVLDGRALVKKRGREAYTLEALLESRGVLAGDGRRYLTEKAIAERVAELSGKPSQSDAAVRQTLSRLRAAFKTLRADWEELIVRNGEVQGYRLALADER